MYTSKVDTVSGANYPLHMLNASPNSANPGFADAATKCAAANLRVIPVKRGGKVPLLVDWPTQATTDTDTITMWAATYPGANLGIVPGDDVVIFDIDPRSGGDATWSDLTISADELPTTVMCQTGGGGLHIYFRLPDGVVVGNSSNPDGVDIKTKGGFVVAPPSIHSSGGRYVWVDGLAPWETDLAQVPEWLLEWAQKRSHKPTGAPDDVVARLDVPDEIAEGARDDSVYKIACRARGWGHTHNEILALIREVNEGRCNPPLPLADLERIAKSSEKHAPNPGAMVAPLTSEDTTDGYPEVITTGRHMTDLIRDAWTVVNSRNDPPRLFSWLGTYARLNMEPGIPEIRPVNLAASVGILARLAEWFVQGDGGQLKPGRPPKDVAGDMIEFPSGKLPRIEEVITTPVVGADGRILADTGFHADARLWLQMPRGLKGIDVPHRPSSNDVTQARELIEELFGDFPFDAQADRAHAIAALVLPFARRLITSPTPLHLVEAPSPGTGKSLLADAIGAVVLGGKPGAARVGKNDEENRKQITAILARSGPIVVADNVRDGLDSPSLASALTSDVWSDRVLGATRNIDLPNRALWIATANNPPLTEEIARRCVRIRLDTKKDRPWEGREFRHKDLIGWAMGRRKDLVRAVLVLVRAWLAERRPEPGVTLGSFESWAQVVGGILANAEVKGFLGNLNELYDAADSETAEWRAFVMAWWEEHHIAWVQSRNLHTLAAEQGHLMAVLGDGTTRSQQIRLGKALGTMRGRQLGDLRIAKRASRSRTAEYRLEKASKTSSEQPDGDVAEVGECGECLVNVETKHSPKKTLYSHSVGECGECGECLSSPARTRAHACAHACTREKASGKTFTNIHHIHQPDEIKEENLVNVGPAHSPQHSPHSPNSQDEAVEDVFLDTFLNADV